MRYVGVHFRAVVIGALAMQACDQPSAPTAPDVLAAEETRMHHATKKKLESARCAFGQEFTSSSVNAYFPISVGSEWSLVGEEDGAFLELRITVLDETEVVGGVATRVIEEVEWEDGELIEVSRNFFAATRDGTVCYFGEDVDIFEDGEIVSHEGAWRADAAGNFPGIIMPAAPRPGMKFRMEGAPGIAEDVGKVVGSGRIRVPAGSFARTIRIRESNPLDGDFDFKAYAKDVGLLVDGPLRLVSYSVSTLSAGAR